MEKYYKTHGQDIPIDMLDKNGWLKEDILLSLWDEVISDYHSCYNAPLYHYRNQFGLDMEEVRTFFAGYAIHLWKNVYLPSKYPDDDYPRGRNGDHEDFIQNFQDYDLYENITWYYESWEECPFTKINIYSSSIAYDFTPTPLWGDISQEDAYYVYVKWRHKDIRIRYLSYTDKPLFHLW